MRIVGTGGMESECYGYGFERDGTHLFSASCWPLGPLCRQERVVMRLDGGAVGCEHPRDAEQIVERFDAAGRPAGVAWRVLRLDARAFVLRLPGAGVLAAVSRGAVTFSWLGRDAGVTRIEGEPFPLDWGPARLISELRDDLPASLLAPIVTFPIFYAYR